MDEIYDHSVLSQVKSGGTEKAVKKKKIFYFA